MSESRDGACLRTAIAHHWDRFYRDLSHVPTAESDFARWVEAKMGSLGLVLEFGCGTGRDSLWFARNPATTVFATDSSRVGLEALHRRAQELQLDERVMALRVDLNSEHSLESLSGRISDCRLRLNPGAKMIAYGRFLLHAVDQSAQDALVNFSSSILRPGDVLALEYRAQDLVCGSYVFGDHFRRPVNPRDLEAQCLLAGFSAVDTVVSDRFAVMHEERPVIARTLAVR